jgi:hypothetical protein
MAGHSSIATFARERRRQELMIVSSGRSTALEHLVSNHHMDKATGELNRCTATEEDQPTVEDYPQRKLLDLKRNFLMFKDLLIRWIVCCHIAIFQFENAYFQQLLFFLYLVLKYERCIV